MVARIGAAHGLRGEVRLRSFTEDPYGFAGYGPLEAGDRSLEVESLRTAKGGLIAKFAGIDTREAAEALNGAELTVSRHLLPDTEDADEFYQSDLIGLQVNTPDGGIAGTIVAVHDFGAGEVIEIRGEGGRSEMFSFTRENFPEIDIESGRAVLVRPETVEAESGTDR